MRHFKFARSYLLVLCGTFCLITAGLQGDDTAKPAETQTKISYYKQIRPIFQVHCQGCHQPAKAGNDYVMTAFDRLLKGGASGQVGIVPGKPDDSELFHQIVPIDGKAAMPKGKAPLAAAEIELVRQWIAAGAVDDTPANARQRYDMEHPPVYTRQPVITALDYSPDGQLLAIAGFHEVLVYKADGSQLVARLVGMSERIESVRFSPDGQKLAVTGGLPARIGEVQVWDVPQRKLLLSVPITYDTIYGGNWSPDGKLISFGCTDNSVRAIDAVTGQQVLFQGAHNDWVRETVFSVDGSHLVSVGRDMSTKLTEVATQRFVDNISSITPGALKGGIQAVARHPQRDEIVIGGADGVAKVYRIQRLTKRVIGDDANLIREMPPMPGRIFSVAVSRDGKRIAAGSSLDGSGEVQVYSYEFDTALPANIMAINGKVVTTRTPEEHKTLAAYHAEGVKLISKSPVPQGGVYAVAFHPEGRTLAAAGADGLIRFIDPETGSITREFPPAPLTADAAPAVTTAATTATATTHADVDFIRDVSPVLSKLGCNQGTCHGSAQGKNGFKLSLRGYDPIFDVRALTDDLASRRVNLASPDDSLMLLKPSGAAPHGGGVVFQPGQPYYKLIRAWIASGAKLDLSVPRVSRIEVQPINPVLDDVGARQQMQVVATYANGQVRDVTAEAFIETGNADVAVADRAGMMTALRRGEAPILARYEGAYAATTMTVMGDRTGFVWQQPPVYNKIDELTARKWERMKILPSDVCTDAEFIRRVSIDLTGLPPTSQEVRDFLADTRDSRLKRNELIDRLIGSKGYVEYWTNKWADLLLVNRKFLGAEGAAKFRAWIRNEVDQNTPYDKFVREILAASGSNRENPAASYFKILRQPTDTMENTTHLFLAVRFNCNKCHDHPFERWTQDQYYQTAAYFAQVDLQRDPESKDRNIGGTAVEGAKPLYEIVSDKSTGDVIHERTGQVAPPEFPFDCDFQAPENPSRREELAAWITARDNPYFARSYVNRLWGYLFGVGIMEPIDDIRAGNPPTNPELLDYLTQEFLRSNFDVRHVVRLICQSRTYQLSVIPNQWNEDDRINYSHATARRLPAEVLLDSVYRVTGSTSRFPGVPAGMRAAELPDSGVELPSGFLTTFGRPPRESACECERSSDLQLGPVMALISGPTISDAIEDPNNDLAKLVASEPDNTKLVNEIFLRVLNRPATPTEVQVTLAAMQTIDADHQKVLALLQQRETEVGALRAQQEQARQQAIAKATVELAAFEQQYAPKRAELEKQKLETTARLEAELKDYSAKLPSKLADWEKQRQPNDGWVPLNPTALTASNGAKLTTGDDLSILAEAKDGPVVYTITAETELAGITGIRLEALADDRLPSKGPGLSPNGNFVVTEFEVNAAPKANPAQPQKVVLQNALADFSQDGYAIATAIDGQRPPQSNGWAVSPNVGVTHWATFETKAPVGVAGGTILTFTLDHRYADRKHNLGKFRLSITTSPKPVGLGTVAEIETLLAIAPDSRNDNQKAALLKFFTEHDEEFKTRTKALADSRLPLPVDPQLKDLQDKLAQASLPVPPDSKLVQLQENAAMSQKQLTNLRLTAAQDLAWALINSPAFLFNH